MCSAAWVRWYWTQGSGSPFCANQCALRSSPPSPACASMVEASASEISRSRRATAAMSARDPAEAATAVTGTSGDHPAHRAAIATTRQSAAAGGASRQSRPTASRTRRRRSACATRARTRSRRSVISSTIRDAILPCGGGFGERRRTLLWQFLEPDVFREELAGGLDFDADDAALPGLRGVLVDQDREDVPVQDVGHLVADGDDVELVPVFLLVIAVDDGRFSQRGEEPRILALFGPHELSLPRDDPASGGLLVELPGVAVAGIEIVLGAPHVPLFLGFRIRRRATGGAARAGSRLRRRRRGSGTTRASGALRRGSDPSAVLHAAVDAAGALHLHLQLEVRRLAPLPHEIDGAGWLLARGLDRDRAVLHLPVFVARPALETLAVEERDPSLVLLEVVRIRLAEPAAAAPAPLSLRTRLSLWRLRRRLLCVDRCAGYQTDHDGLRQSSDHQSLLFADLLWTPFTDHVNKEPRRTRRTRGVIQSKRLLRASSVSFVPPCERHSPEPRPPLRRAQLQRRDLLPLPVLRRAQDGVGDEIGREAVAEGRRQALAAVGGRHEVCELVREGVLVANLQAWNPPVLHVRLVAVGDVDVAPAADAPFVLVIEVLETVQVVEIPERRRVLAVDLECVERLVAARVAGRF